MIRFPLVASKDKILQILDPAHKTWVQGGVFKDLREASNFFFSDPVYLPAPLHPLRFFNWLKSCLKIFRHQYVLFSSLTPLENYRRFPWRPAQSIGLWFTHKERELTSYEIECLRECTVVFVHSDRARTELREIGIVNVVVTVGALRLERFKESPETGNHVVWVGTPHQRKRPDLLLEVAKLLPNISFLVLGKGWRESNRWNELKYLTNVEYREIVGPLCSEDFKGCGIYLMTSEIEGGPMPLMESVAAGLFPICTDTGFVNEIFEIIDEKPVIIPLNSEIISLKIIEVLETIEQGKSLNSSRIFEFTYERLASSIYEGLIVPN